MFDYRFFQELIERLEAFVLQDAAQCRVGPIALRESLAVGLA